jgi:hypothetical protein
MKIAETSNPVNTLDQNRKMACWTKKIVNREVSFMERLDPDDWANFISFSDKQGIAPVLYHTIKDSPPGSLSEYSLSKLRNIYLENIHRNIILYDELCKILKKLNAADIPVIVLKGSFLAKTVYENIGLRLMGDMDLLVERKDIMKTVQVLETIGYSGEFDFDIANGFSVHQHLPPLEGPKRIPVEVHWTIIYFFHLDVRAEKEIVKIWERAQPLAIEDTPCLMLAPDDLLMHLCLHISRQHLYSMRLRGFLDLRQVIKHYNSLIDWDWIQKQACLLGMDRAVKLTLYLADRWVGLDLPDCVRKTLDTDLPDPEIMYWIEEKMFNETPLCINTKLPEFIAGKSVLRKIVILWRQFFVSRAILSCLYKVNRKSMKIYFYYPVRWGSLCRRYGPIVWKAWKGDRAMINQLQQENDLRQWLT